MHQILLADNIKDINRNELKKVQRACDVTNEVTSDTLWTNNIVKHLMYPYFVK
jgi:hypothetical protein